MEIPEQSFASTQERYNVSIPLYKKLVEEVKHVLEVELQKESIPATLSGRTKHFDSFVLKTTRKQYKDPFSEITDLAGARVVCSYEADLHTVGEVITSTFDVREIINKVETLGVDKMGYNGAHYVIILGNRFSGTRYDDIKYLHCEIQVRTIL